MSSFSQTAPDRNREFSPPYIPLVAIFPRVARAADDLARVAVTLAHEAAQRDSRALAADALRAKQLAHLAARLAVVVEGDLREVA
jgi:hypothetical protein